MRTRTMTTRLMMAAALVTAIGPALAARSASADDPGTGVISLVPARLLDTRPGATTVDGVSAGAGLPEPGATVVLKVVGRGGVPANGVDAVVLNITAVNEVGGNGFVTVFPTGSPQPN